MIQHFDKVGGNYYGAWADHTKNKLLFTQYFFLIQKLSCTAKVSSSTILLDVCYMECSLSCGKDENCGAYFVKEESGYQCFLIELDDDGNYKNKADLVDSTSVKYYYSMSDYE